MYVYIHTYTVEYGFIEGMEVHSKAKENDAKLNNTYNIDDIYTCMYS
jgi:hypothetical protein